MTAERRRVLFGVVAGLLWSGALLVGAALYVTLPVFTLVPTILTAFLPPGLVMMLMVARLEARRFFEGQSHTGPLSKAGEVDRYVVQNTVEQLVLAAAIWPAAAVLLGPYGPGVIVTLGLGFALARVVFWVGCHRGLRVRTMGLQALGSAATFFPTALTALWAITYVLF